MKTLLLTAIMTLTMMLGASHAWAQARVCVGGGCDTGTTETFADCMKRSPATDQYKCNYLPESPMNTDENQGKTDNQIAMSLSQQLYCQSKNVLAGNLGLLLGLGLALMGLYQMVSGNLVGGLILLICGALITALPSLVESTMKGTYEFTKIFRDDKSGEMCVPVCNGSVAAPGPGCQK